jgi:hypothetical protein
MFLKLFEFNDKIQLMENFAKGSCPDSFFNYKPFQNRFFCHPERSEGSQRVENTRFFAPLRMTISSEAGFEIACKN